MKSFTLANAITVLRFILIIPFLYFLFLKEGNFLGLKEFSAKLTSLIIFVFASATDYFDGYIARIYKEESKLGKFLDPLADKFLVASALIAFIQLEPDLIPYWMVLLIILREFIITALRITALNQSRELETMKLGKTKTTLQLLTIIIILFFFVLKSHYYPSAPISLEKFLSEGGEYVIYTPFLLMLLTTIITVVSGVRYLIKNRVLFIGE
ncbi:MAG: CDP-diacylglycerol--glycerol-3-phosphate 3-phosphatidyltransferase [Spirochaetota bacterium]|nr:CDP-diacylglycerol--glycerol-3-phosphate 3-phosphatidyltransferase [Spirochaetota bacterium]